MELVRDGAVFRSLQRVTATNVQLLWASTGNEIGQIKPLTGVAFWPQWFNQCDHFNPMGKNNLCITPRSIGRRKWTQKAARLSIRERIVYCTLSQKSILDGRNLVGSLIGIGYTTLNVLQPNANYNRAHWKLEPGSESSHTSIVYINIILRSIAQEIPADLVVWSGLLPEWSSVPRCYCTVWHAEGTMVPDYMP